MPYIKQSDRKRFELNIHPPRNPGELNFVITKVITEYLKYKGISYSTFNDIIGVLSCAKMEIYRRLVSDYEDKKIEENGEVF